MSILLKNVLYVYRARNELTRCLRSGIIVSQTSFYKFVLPLLKQLWSQIKSFKRCNSKARLLPVLPHTVIGSGEIEAQRLRTILNYLSTCYMGWPLLNYLKCAKLTIIYNNTHMDHQYLFTYQQKGKMKQQKVPTYSFIPFIRGLISVYSPKNRK